MDDSQKVTFPERCVAERHCHSHGVVCHGSVNQENSILKVASEKQTLNICIKLFTDFMQKGALLLNTEVLVSVSKSPKSHSESHTCMQAHIIYCFCLNVLLFCSFGQLP